MEINAEESNKIEKHTETGSAIYLHLVESRHLISLMKAQLSPLPKLYESE